jgi:RHS repeat-associated protein
MGNIVALGNAPGANPASETYGYDPLYRLKAVTDSSTAVESYTYNGTGDRVSKTSTGGMATGAYGYQAGTHWLTTIGSAARSYDLNGNTIGSASGGQTLGFGYNNRNRLSLVQSSQQTIATYTYNALGQRIGKAVTVPSAANQRFAYGESGQLVSETGSSAKDYVWLGNTPVAIVDTGGVVAISYIHADALDTPRVISDASGTLIWQWVFAGNPFGEKSPAGSYAFNLRGAGQYFDPETNAFYNMRRGYDSTTGRFRESDPAGLDADISTYSYVANNPLVFVDPTGLDAIAALRHVKYGDFGENDETPCQKRAGKEFIISMTPVVGTAHALYEIAEGDGSFGSVADTTGQTADLAEKAFAKGAETRAADAEKLRRVAMYNREQRALRAASNSDRTLGKLFKIGGHTLAAISYGLAVYELHEAYEECACDEK